ncbi:MAG: hypothetical protein GC181_11520 [Bacteroidetes bacterium]|nr:hypothetical protein [Bacteroidota bacterium]
MKQIIRLTVFIFLISPMFFIGCTCDCSRFVECENTINFAFDLDSANGGFKRSEIDSFVLYMLNKGEVIPRDSLIFVWSDSFKSYGISGICAFDNSPGNFSLFDEIFSPKKDLQDCDYLIKVPEIRIYYLHDLEVNGVRKGSLTCRCYQNDTKKITVDEEPFDVLKMDNPVIILRKE